MISYLQSRDEIIEIWAKRNISALLNSKGMKLIGFETLINLAVEVAKGAHRVLVEAIKESTVAKLESNLVGQTDKSLSD